MKRSESWLTLVGVLMAAQASDAQDLFERGAAARDGNSPTVTAEYRGRDRLDLRVTGALPTMVGESGSARIGVQASVDSDFACGRFDVKATLKSLVGKEAREDFLKALIGSLESQLTYNALVLACEASPTACTAFQHFRVNANAMLGMQYDRCQAVEQAVRDGLQGVKAKAIKDCVEQKRRNGRTMAEALEACEKSETLRDLEGREVKEIDLLEEIRKTFKLGEIEFQRLQTLLSPLAIGPSGARGQVQSDGALRRFDDLNADYQRAWTELVGRQAREDGAQPSAEDLKRLSPPGQPGVLPAEATDIAKLPATQRQVLIRSLAGQAALSQLVTEVQDLERKLAALRKSPQIDQDRARRLEWEADDLRLQVRHLDERVRRNAEFAQELLRASGLALQHQGRAAAESIVAGSDGKRDNRLLREVAPKFGTLKGCPAKDCDKKGSR